MSAINQYFGNRFLPTNGGNVEGTLGIQQSGANGLELLQDGSDSTLSTRLFWLTGDSAKGLSSYNDDGELVIATGANPGVTSGVERVRFGASAMTLQADFSNDGYDIESRIIDATVLLRTPTQYWRGEAPQWRMYDTNGPDPNDWLYGLYNNEVYKIQWRDQSASTYYDLIQINCSSSPTGTLFGAWTVGGVLTLSEMDLSGLPTSDPAIAGRAWVNSGVVTVSAG